MAHDPSAEQETMTEGAIDRLLAAMGPALGPKLTGTEAGVALVGAHGQLGSELAGMLLARNGCFSNTRALLIRPLERGAAPKGLVEWNDESGWRAAYQADLSGALFFAEDLFGEQFALRGNAVWRFDPESGDWTHCAPTLRAWAEMLLGKEGRPDLESSLAARWQAAHGGIPDGTRLRPPVPFLFEESASATLHDYQSIPEDEVMAHLASIANALQDVPDGTTVRLRRAAMPEGEKGAPASRGKRRRWWPFGSRG